MKPLFDYEQYNDHPALYYPKLAAVIGLNESIFLAQLHYWLEQSRANPKLGRRADGRNWIFNSYENWQAESFPFWSHATVKRTANSVVKMGLALKRNDLHAARFQYNQTLFWSIDYDQLAALVKEAAADDSAAPGDDLTNEPAAEPDQLTAPGDTQQVNLTNCANNADTTGQFDQIQQVNLTRYNRSICTDTTGQFDQIPETTSETTSENTFRDSTATTTPAPKNGNTAASLSLNGGSGSGNFVFNESDFLNFYDRYASRPNRFGLNTAQTRKIETAYAILGPDRFWVAMEKSLTTNPRQTVTTVISSLTVTAAENEALSLAEAALAHADQLAEVTTARPSDDQPPSLPKNSTNGPAMTPPPAMTESAGDSDPRLTLAEAEAEAEAALLNAMDTLNLKPQIFSDYRIYAGTLLLWADNAEALTGQIDHPGARVNAIRRRDTPPAPPESRERWFTDEEFKQFFIT